MREIMYGWNSLWIAGWLLTSMVATIEVGYRIGRRKTASANKATKDHINTIQGSMLGVLALLLAFSFSIAVQRFDNRNAAVVEEANAIGTTFLRAQLLPSSVRSDASKLLQRYVDLRVQASTISLNKDADRDELLSEANQVLGALWDCARRAAEENPNPVTAGLFIQSLNETIDSYGRRDATVRRHVPEVVLFLLFGTFVMAGGVLGYATGVAGHRPSSVSYMLVGLIIVLTFVIVDLDRPRRGLIRVDQTSLIDVKAVIDKALSASAQPAVPANGASPRR
jgi:uncharacterized membrane protein (Fun14 family)